MGARAGTWSATSSAPTRRGMAGIDEVAEQLREDIAAAQREHARAAHALEQATTRRDTAGEAPEREFTVKPGNAAGALLARPEDEAADEAARVRAALDEAGAPA